MSPGKISERLESLSLQNRMFILLIVMLLPFISFFTYKAFDINERLETESQSENLKLAKTVAHDIDEFINSTGDVLIPITKNKYFRGQDYPAATAYLEELVPEYPFYHLFAFVDLDGNVKAVAMSSIMAKSEDAKNVQVNVKDTACYMRGVKSKGISIGDFMYSKYTGMPVVHVTYPVFDYSNKRIGFVAAAFDLTKIQNKIMQINTDKHIVISIVDDKGVYIARNRDPRRWVGKSIANTDRYKLILGKTEGMYKTQSSDNTLRIYSFSTTSNAPWFVRVGIDQKYILEQVRKELVNYGLLFAPFLLVAILGWLWIGRDVNKLHKKTEYLTLVDPLTGLWNCRKLDQDFCRELSFARRHKEQLSFAMIDIDHFKNYNDNYGHPVGDNALRTVSEVIRDAVRDTDLVYRYGGEEICVLLPRTDTAGAALVCERIRDDVEKTRFSGEEKQPSGKLTISIGYATYPHDSISKEGLIKSADTALYKAKNNGRNRVEAYETSGQETSGNDFYPFSQCI